MRSHYEATALGSQSPASTVGSLVLLRLRCYCPPDANPMTRIGDRARMGRRIPGTGGGRGPGDANSKTGSATLLQDKRTGTDQSVAGGGESDAGPTPFVQGAGQVLDGFAAYRMMQRRIADAAQRGIMLPFFQPRDGVSGGTIRWDGRELVNFSGYNYLGLSGHPAVSRAAKDAIDEYGTSASASRIVSGEIALHGVLERRLASFLGTDDCLVFVSGYLTNVTVIGHLFSRPDVIVHDAMAHNSIITGCRLSEARVLSFPHDDWAGLDAALTPLRGSAPRGLLVPEGVYSIDADVIHIAHAVAAKRRHDLLLMVDEAHSFGILGPTGRGVCERAGLAPSSIDIHMGTLSKTLASCGGDNARHPPPHPYLLFMPPPFPFFLLLFPPASAALPPSPR